MSPLKHRVGPVALLAFSLGLLSLVLPGVDSASANSKPKKDAKGKQGAEEEAEDVDYVGLAAKLIKDGHHDRAAMVLDEVDESQEGLDLIRYHTLRGIVRLQLKLYTQARESFVKAIKAGQKEKIIHLYLAQAYYGENDFKAVIEQLNLAGAEGTKSPALVQMRAQAHWELKQHSGAIAALTEGSKQFPQDAELPRIKLFRLVELGLFQEALRLGRDFLSRENITVDDYLAIGQALREGKQFKDAREILQTARLRYPENVTATLQLAHTYVDDKRPLTAAMLYEDAARVDAKYMLETAELYKQAGRLDRALYVNAQVSDQKAKMKQRLSILLALERFEQIVAMEPRLSRLGLLNDQNIRYALAYAEFKTGNFNSSEAHIKRIEDRNLYEAALQLRKAMEDCKSAGWECH